MLQPTAIHCSVRITESVWRASASQHRDSILNLIRPGLLLQPPSKVPRQHNNNQQQPLHNDKDELTALDPRNPIYNFLIEYYGLKGTKGTRRLLRWAPPPALLFGSAQKVESQDQLQAIYTNDYDDDASGSNLGKGNPNSNVASLGKIILEGACEDDLGGILHLRGAMMDESGGISYSPSTFYGRFTDIPDQQLQQSRHDNNMESNCRSVQPYLWYRSVLRQTLSAEPVLYCHGLHEWAMLYHPDGAPSPPSAKYQAHLPKRVSRSVINELVESRGVSCTHVDALRFFAPAAAPLNHHGCPLPRIDQLRMEQPACVHANMDLLKMALRLQPFVDSKLLVQSLDVALQARRLDVAASPYDASAYGICAVPVETAEGRVQYRKEQSAIMERAQVVRRELLQSYDQFLYLAFDHAIIEEAKNGLASSKSLAVSSGLL